MGASLNIPKLPTMYFSFLVARLSTKSGVTWAAAGARSSAYAEPGAAGANFGTYHGVPLSVLGILEP